MRRSLAAATALVLAGALAAAAPAGATIVVNRSIAGVRLNDTTSRVRQTLGAPASTARTRDRSGFGPELVWRYRRLTVRFARSSGRVISVDTSRRAQRTAADVGVGTTSVRLLEAYPKAQCDAALHSCLLEDARHGAQTIFGLNKGIVNRVGLYSVYD